MHELTTQKLHYAISDIVIGRITEACPEINLLWDYTLRPHLTREQSNELFSLIGDATNRAIEAAFIAGVRLAHNPGFLLFAHDDTGVRTPANNGGKEKHE